MRPGRGLALFGCALSAAVGCRALPLPSDIGTSSPRESVRERPPEGAKAGADAGLWSEAALEALAPVTPSAVASRGHLLERVMVTVRGNDAGRAIYSAPRGFAEVGALLVAVHSPKDGGATDDELSDTKVMVMEKGARGSNPATADWQFAVARRSGEVVASGPLPLCVTCHREAPVDYVFRAPE